MQSAAWTESMARQLLSPPTHPEMLGRIGRYEVERLIGSGGMGVVFKAFDTELNRPVAVKALAPHLAGSGAARNRFAREARAAAAVVHDHVVAIHNVESEGASPFLVMPYVAGESLQQRIDREGSLELCEILRIVKQTAAGLAAAHAQGLVHRDVKPSNILLEQGVERALLTDFGLARASDDASLTHTGYHPGTPQYMSPEQARGEAVDARSDLFSLGSVVYALCTGRPPFRAETSYGILRRITDNQPRPIREVNAAIPDWLEAIVEKLLAKNPAERFQSAEELAELLEQCLAHVQQPTSVGLPAECKAMVANAHRHSKEASPWRAIRTWSTRFALHRQPRRAWSAPLLLLAVSGITIAILAAQPEFWRLRQETPTSESAPTSPPQGAAPAPSAVAPSAATSLWDATAVEIDSYRDTLAPFETRSQQLWDDPPPFGQE
ncbi:MAG: serine/threonine protein kinase [Planctomycetales bacterium]|nr:serine/threonine protein kinase [Planctomycetales bacterium]